MGTQKFNTSEQMEKTRDIISDFLSFIEFKVSHYNILLPILIAFNAIYKIVWDKVEIKPTFSY